MRCPKCRADALEYVEDITGGEVESWHCGKCSAAFNVPIEIVRDFKAAELSGETYTIGREWLAGALGISEAEAARVVEHCYQSEYFRDKLVDMLDDMHDEITGADNG